MLDERASLGVVVSIDPVSIAISPGSSVRSLERIRLLLFFYSRKDPVDRLAGQEVGECLADYLLGEIGFGVAVEELSDGLRRTDQFR